MTDVRARTNAWETRRRRARHLARDRVHARELLSFYERLLDVQEGIHHRVARAAMPGCPPPPIRLAGWLHDLPQAALIGPFREFISNVGAAATATVREVGQRLQSVDQDLLSRLLRDFATQQDLNPLANEMRCDVEPTAFFPRAFLQPIAETLREDRRAVRSGTDSRLCPACDFPPQVSLLQDLEEVKGQRRLVCALCASTWHFPRLVCPACGTSDAESLLHHTSDTWSHVRIEECRQCRMYIKTFDLRIDGAAVPLVDDIASVELDLWAAEQDLTKLQRNLLGL